MDKHDTLLIACGTSENRRQLRGVLQERYHLLEATNTPQTLLLLKQNMDCIAAVLIDITQPETADLELLQQHTSTELLQQVPVIVICAEDSPQLLAQIFGWGAADVIPLDYEPYAMLCRIGTIVELHRHKQYLETMVQEQADILRNSNETMVDALSAIIEYRSVESGQHILRIRHFTKILLEEVARCCPEYRLDERTIAIISSASALHDIGKIAIPDSILTKPGRLTREEMEVMKTHSLTGCQILDTLGGMADQEYLRYAHNICHYHHERWDGSGYPEGLSGEGIPICAQVVGLADAYDALTTKRVYKDAYPFAQAVNMILRGQCGAFSPKLLECFKHITDQYEDLARDYADGLSPKTEAFDTTLPAPQLQEENSLERVRAKYNALVHYINGLLIEVDLNRGLLHLIYNPYPDMNWLENVDTLDDMEKLMTERILLAEDQKQLSSGFSREVLAFMKEDLRRSTRHVRFRSRRHPEGELFEVTMLRIHPLESNRRTLAILCRRVADGEPGPAVQQAETEAFHSTLICRNDAHFTLLRLGRNVPALLGHTREELAARFGDRLLELVLPEDREALRHTFSQQLRRSTEAEGECRVRSKDGSVQWMLIRSRLRMEDGEECLHCFLSDITAFRQEYEELNDKLRRYEIILSQTENVLFEWDMETDRMSFSETWEKIFGYPPIQGSVRETLSTGYQYHPDDLPLLLDCISRLENGSNYEMVEVRLATARGRYLWVRYRATAIRDESGNLTKICGVIINIDTEKRAEQRLQERAERDALTKLLNKTAGRKQAEEYLSRFPQGVNSAMLIIDLDHFKQVNDQYGHLFGDAVLTKVAREIEKLFRAQDIVSRIGGDEFLVLMRGVSDRALLESRCQRLLSILAGIFRNQKYNLPLSCSIGIALSPEHGTSYYELFNHADQALYRAKAGGRNQFCFYEKQEEACRAFQVRDTAVSSRIDSDEELGLAEDNLVRYALQRLYSAKDVDSAVNEVLGLVGKKMNVSRVYVFENSDDNRFCSNTYEWCNEGIPSEKANLQNISYETDIPDYADNFNEQGIFYCPDIAQLPKQTYDIVAPQGIKSMLHCAIRENGVFRGYIGFDECVEKRLWTKDQIQLLISFSETLSIFLLKQHQQKKAREQAMELQTILDNQNAWIYIIDPDTCQLKYRNAKCRHVAPDAAPGAPCYQVLMNRTERCPGCPSAAVRQSKTNSALLRDGKFPMDILVEATLIQWQGEEACLMTCRKMPK